MSLRGLLILVLLLLAALAVLRWTGSAPPPASPAIDPPLLQPFLEASVQEIDIEREGAPLTLRRDGGRNWRVVRPFEAEADPRRVHDVVAALQDARVRKTIVGAAADPSAFGLAPAACTVRIDSGAEATAQTVRIGRSSPVGTERYAAAGGAQVALTDGSLFAAIARDPESFREKRLVPLDAGDIARIEVTHPPDRIAIVMSGGSCRLEAPLPDAGAASACENLARAVASVEMSAPFVPRPPADAKADALIALEVTAKGASVPLRAFLAAPGRDGRLAAWREGSAFAGLVSASVVPDLTRPADSFRDARIVAFPPAEVRRMTIERGPTILRLERAGETGPWTASSGSAVVAVGADRADALVEAFHDLTGSGFLADAPATAPSATVAASGERGELARLTFGPVGPPAEGHASSVWVTTPSRPGVVFRLDASEIPALPKNAADLAPAATSAAPAAGGS